VFRVRFGIIRFARECRNHISVNGNSWHNSDLRLIAPEGPLSSGLPTLGAEGLVSGGKPTWFRRALKVGT
jgi:hypothetical protein